MQRTGRRPLGVLLTGLLVLALTVPAALLPLATARAHTGEDQALGGEALHGRTWGELRGDPGGAFTESGPLVPATPEQARADQPGYYSDPRGSGGEGCHVMASGVELLGCVYGDPDGGTTVWVVGSSKAGQWMEALLPVAEREGWRLVVHTKSACSLTVGMATPDYPECAQFNDRVMQLMAADPPDVVLTAAYRSSNQPVTPEVLDATWEAIAETGVRRIASVWDSPMPRAQPAGCLEGDPGSYLECAYGTRVSEAGQALQDAVRAHDDVAYIDMEPWVCPPSALSPRCPAVVGGVQTTGKGTHLTASYVSTLSGALHEQLHRAGIADSGPPAPRVWRLSGKNRYATAAQVALSLAGTGTRVYVASGQDYADALSAGAVVDDGDGLLLTKHDQLPAVTADALDRLGPAEIVVVGGEQAVSEEVAAELGGYAATVTRVAGEDRFGTAAALATAEPLPAGSSRRAFLVTGTQWADAVAAAPLTSGEVPVLLTRRGAVPKVTLTAMRELGIDSVQIAGGTDVVSEQVVSQLREQLPGVQVTRAAGRNRYATAAELVREWVGPQPETVYVATGATYADALAAAQGHRTDPVLLVRRDGIPGAAARELERLAPRTIVVLGDEGVVSDAVRRPLAGYLGH